MQFIQSPLTLPHTLLHPRFKHTQSKIFSPRYQVPQPNTKTSKEGTCKVLPVQSNKTYRGSREIHPLIINLGTRWRSAVKCMAGLLHARSKPPFLLRGRLHVPPSQFGHFRNEKDLILLAGIEPTVLHYHSSEQQVKLKSCLIHDYILICIRALTACDKLLSNCNLTLPLVGGLQSVCSVGCNGSGEDGVYRSDVTSCRKLLFRYRGCAIPYFRLPEDWWSPSSLTSDKQDAVLCSGLQLTDRARGDGWYHSATDQSLFLRPQSDFVKGLQWRSSFATSIQRIPAFKKLQNQDPFRSQWPLGLRRGSAAAGLLGLRVRIPSAAWMSISCECWVLSGRGLCVRPIPRPEESYWLCVCVCVCVCVSLMCDQVQQ